MNFTKQMTNHKTSKLSVNVVYKTLKASDPLPNLTKKNSTHVTSIYYKNAAI
jgi:hypothetical protein